LAAMIVVPPRWGVRARRATARAQDRSSEASQGRSGITEHVAGDAPEWVDPGGSRSRRGQWSPPRETKSPFRPQNYRSVPLFGALFPQTETPGVSHPRLHRPDRTPAPAGQRQTSAGCAPRASRARIPAPRASRARIPAPRASQSCVGSRTHRRARAQAALSAPLATSPQETCPAVLARLQSLRATTITKVDFRHIARDFGIHHANGRTTSPIIPSSGQCSQHSKYVDQYRCRRGSIRVVIASLSGPSERVRRDLGDLW
jgi:hypothetical protein